jgi:glycosyltransferase involved in cell wall biosynthesis
LKKRNDLKILCLGNVIYPPHIDELTAYLKTTGLDRYILMPGFYPNVESFYSISDAFILPSFVEGWSVAMNEAMFHEKPMILTDTGGSSEVIRGNDIGILIPNEYGDTIQLTLEKLDRTAYVQKKYSTSLKLSEAMTEMADNREEWKIAGRGGKKKIIQQYDFKKIIPSYEKIFIKLAENNASN